MKIVIRNSLLDLLAFGSHLKLRKRIFSKAHAGKLGEGSINRLSRQLHPQTQALKIESVTDESPDTRSFRLIPRNPGQKVAPFRAGQYLVLCYEDDGLILSRPYSISSSPSESIEGNYYRVTIKKKDREHDGYFSDGVFRLWNVNSQVSASGPQGYFYYEPLRDAANLICIAGGAGITPFCSLIPEELKKQSELKITLFYGFNSREDYLFSDYFDELQKLYPQRLKIIALSMENDGYIRASHIREELTDPDNTSFFLCGPPGLHRHLDAELSSFSIRPKFLRSESYGSGTLSVQGAVSEYKLQLHMGGDSIALKAVSNETLLTAMERGGVNAPSSCRSGECGWCRSQLISGEIASDHGLTAIRQADRKFGWIHPCVSYPAGDIILKVPEDPDREQ